MLIARTQGTLDAVKKECEQMGVETCTTIADFAENSGILPAAVLEQLGNKCVSVLVNNIGGLPPPSLPKVPNPSYCEDIDYATYDSYWRFNVAPTIQMTHLVLSSMVRRDKGCIINVSSLNGLQACPYLSHYSAAKAYILSYSACLRNELQGRGSGVRVEAVCPGPVATDGIGRANMPSPGIPDPVEFAERSLSLVGTPYATIPWPRHWWSTQFHGPNSFFLSREATEKRLFKTLDFLGPRHPDDDQRACHSSQ